MENLKYFPTMLIVIELQWQLNVKQVNTNTSSADRTGSFKIYYRRNKN